MRALVLSLLLLSVGHAESQNDYYEITEVETEKIYDQFLDYDIDTHGIGDIDLKTISSDVKILIGVGKEVWKIVEKGKPVANVEKTNVLHVLPTAEDGKAILPYELEQWSMPKISKYRTTFKNSFGMKVIDFIYSIQYQYGGKYNQSGNYLTGITIIPNYVDVSWGFEFDVESKVLNISNLNTLTDPTGAMTLQIKYKSKSAFKTIEKRAVFTVAGDGQILKN